MQERIKEHDRDIPLACTQSSAVSEQAHEPCHDLIWNKLKFIDWDPCWYTRRVKEAIHIRLHPRTSTEIAELKILKHGYPQSKHTTTGKWYNSGPLRKQLLARTMGGLKCTNHNWPSWYKRSHVISTPHQLKKTSSKQLKRGNLHLKWLSCETNDNTLCYCIYHCVQQQRYPQQYYLIMYF